MSSSRVFVPRPSAVTTRVVVSTCACQFRASPSRPGACTATSAATPNRDTTSRANASTSSRRSAGPSSCGKASSYSRATFASLRRSAASAAFHNRSRSSAHPAPSGATTNAASTPPRRP